MVRLYTPTEMERAVNMVITYGKTARHVSDATGIPYRTLTGHIRDKKRGVEKKKPGPKPLLPVECEDSIAHWIAGM